MDQATDDELDRLVDEFDAVEEEFWEAANKATSGWQLKIGPLYAKRHIGSQAIARIFIAFCLTCFVAGAALALTPSTRELGVAMVVGAIFAGGSFIIQLWGVQIQQEKAFAEKLFEEEKKRYFRSLMKRRDRLAAQIEKRRPGYFAGQA